jgi:Ca2+:H+ antiporter
MVQSSAKGAAERPHHHRTGTYEGHEEPAAAHAAGGHDAPNWSRTKSSVILLTATIAYAIIAEILVNTVDVVLEGSNIDEKFLGITLFALVPNTTEFLVSIEKEVHC